MSAATGDGVHRGASSRPYSVRIFLPDGDPEGLRIVLRSNWSGVGLVCPRSVLGPAQSRPEFDGPAVYILEGADEEGGLPLAYIGQTESLRTRLGNHQSKLDFWTRVIAFTAPDGSLNSAFVRHLESRLVRAAKHAKRSTLQNATEPGTTPLSEADRADADAFLDEILKICPLVGLKIFEPAVQRERAAQVFSMSPKGVSARGFESSEGFTVLEGSIAQATEVASIHDYLTRLRQQLVEEGVLAPHPDGLSFTQDYTFASPSTAAGVVAGRSANGRVEWRLDNGKTLREAQLETDPPATP